MSTETIPAAETAAPVISSKVRLDGGEVVLAALNSGEAVLVKVALLPERHLMRFLDFCDVGRESDMLEFTLRRNIAAAGAEPVFAVVNLADDKERAAQAEFVDSLTPESFAQLLEVAERLNRFRSVCSAERQIGRANALLPLKQRTAAAMLEPIEKSLKSLMSSVISQISSAAPASKPETKP